MSSRRQYISYTDLVYRCELEEQNIKNLSHNNNNSTSFNGNSNSNEKRQKVRHVEKCLSVTYDRSPTCGSLPDLVKLKVNQHQVDHKHPKTYLSTRSTLSNVDLRSYILYRPSSTNNTPVKGKYRPPKLRKRSSNSTIHKPPKNDFFLSKIEWLKSRPRNPSKSKDQMQDCDCRIEKGEERQAKFDLIEQYSGLHPQARRIDLVSNSPLLKRSLSHGSIPSHRKTESSPSNNLPDRQTEKNTNKWRIQPINILQVQGSKPEEKKGRFYKLFQEMKKLNIFRSRHHAIIMSPSPDIGGVRKLQRRETWSYMRVRSEHQLHQV